MRCIKKKIVWIKICFLIELGMSNLIDYDKFYLYSIVTHSTAIEGSTMTEVENQVLLKRAWHPGERAWKNLI